jgi:6-phosphogluconolactonase
MRAEENLEQMAKSYEEEIRRNLDKHLFDLVMLGLGEDGHTASLFPNTPALSIEDRLVVPNHAKTWRMTLTFPCINQSSRIALYALGAAKQNIVPQVLGAAILSPWPASRIGTPERKALWILDRAAASKFQT